MDNKINIAQEIFMQAESLTKRALDSTNNARIILAEIESLNQQLGSELASLGKKRKKGGLNNEELLLFKKLVETKNVIQSTKANIPEQREGDDYRKVLKETFLKMENLPSNITQKFIKEFSLLDENYQVKFLDRVQKDILNEPNIVRRVTGIRGVLFEITRINLIVKQGKEKSADQSVDIPITFHAYPEAVKSFRTSNEYIEKLPQRLKEKVLNFFRFDDQNQEWRLKEDVGLNKLKSIFKEQEMSSFVLAGYLSESIATETKKSSIDLDVPILRQNDSGEEKPYIYETKSYSRRILGQIPSNYNQLLKYNEAVEQGLVDGASVEIEGRIDPLFLKWASGEFIHDQGHIPNVEIIYNMPLPSGNEYRFVLKRSVKSEGLQFVNEDHNYTQEDKIVIAGLQKSMVDKSVLKILSYFNENDFEENLRPYLGNPTLIEDINLYQLYDTQRLNSLWKQLTQKNKEERVNTDNKKNACTEFANREYVEKSIIEYQSYLKQNPDIAKIKKNYILKAEQIPLVIDKTMEMISKVREFELERQKSVEESQRLSQRNKLGYKGLDEGVSLDIDHIIIDAIQDLNKQKGKAGRSYDNPERFFEASRLPEYLRSKESQRYIEIEIYDPVKNKIFKQTGLKQAEKIESEIVRENLSRLESVIEEPTEDKRIQRSLKMNATRVNNLKKRINIFNQEKDERMSIAKSDAKRTKDFSQVQKIALEYQEKIQEIQTVLMNTYIEIIGGEKEFEKIAKRVTKIIDQDIVKFIYVVKNDGTIILDEEIVRGEVSGRAAHSELAQGRNVYGAGELVCSKHNETFSTYEEWKNSKKLSSQEKNWELTEINNGSGHYRPSAKTLKYVKSLVEEKGIDTSRVKLNDTLIRGLNLSEVGFFE